MQVSIMQLEMALGKLKYEMLGYTDDHDMTVSVELTHEDPGTGVMTDCLTIKATAPANTKNEETSMVVEVYPETDKIPPRASKTKSFIVTSKY